MRPLTAGQILDNTFRLFRENFTTLFLLTLLLPGLISAVYELLIVYFSDETSVLITSLLYFVLFYFIIFPLYNGLVTLCACRHIQGEKSTLNDLIRYGKPFMGKYLRTNLCLAVAFLGFIPLILILFLLMSLGVAFVSGIGMVMPGDPLGQDIGAAIAMAVIAVLFFIAVLSLLLWPPLVYPVIYHENLYGFKAVGRAITLGFRRFWRLLGVMILFGLLFMIMFGGVMSVALFLIGIFGSGLYIDQWLENTYATLVVLVIYQVFTPLFMLVYVWLYTDLRARLEGTDLILATEAAPLDSGLTDSINNAYVIQ